MKLLEIPAHGRGRARKLDDQKYTLELRLIGSRQREDETEAAAQGALLARPDSVIGESGWDGYRDSEAIVES
jgi:hypothetical protein